MKQSKKRLENPSWWGVRGVICFVGLWIVLLGLIIIVLISGDENIFSWCLKNWLKLWK